LQHNTKMLFLRKPKNATAAALSWFKAWRVGEQGVVVHTREPIPYPEVTGYFVPTLYEWGEDGLAQSCLRWLLRVQHADGAFPAVDGVPYSFDTAQVMRGLVAALERGEAVREPLARAACWLVGQTQSDGRLGTPSTELWGDIANDLIHVYAAWPLIRAGELLGEPAFVETGRRIHAFYCARPELVPFNRLSHFHAYAMEALVELGETALARRGMAEVAQLQRRDGSVPAYPNVGWICSTGIAQYAGVWYRLGEIDRGDRALAYLERIQNRSGGFFGSYGNGAKYISGAEISWAVKYFLDACALRARAAR
jgi:malonyl-CoA O-methyltransferase